MVFKKKTLIELEASTEPSPTKWTFLETYMAVINQLDSSWYSDKGGPKEYQSLSYLWKKKFKTRICEPQTLIYGLFFIDEGCVYGLTVAFSNKDR